MTAKEVLTVAVIGVRKFWIIETALTYLAILALGGWIDETTFLSGFKTVFIVGIGGNVLNKALEK